VWRPVAAPSGEASLWLRPLRKVCASVCVGCNEPGPFPERYLGRGTPGSLLMAFPGTGAKAVTSTEVSASTRSATQRGPGFGVALLLSPSTRERLRDRTP
jgi:hypothetical protein